MTLPDKVGHDGQGPGGGDQARGSEGAVAGTVTVRYFAAARAAAGTPTESVAAGTVDEMVKRVTDRHGADLARVLTACSFLVNGLTCHDRWAALPAGATVDVLPPFAGG